MRLLQEVHGRTVTVLQHDSKVYAIDTACFHQGGPLGTEGDIEDIDGVACLRCPWHGYRVHSHFDTSSLACYHVFDFQPYVQVNLVTGGQVQTDLSGHVCEQHGKQRTHNVYDGGDGHYWQVQLPFCLLSCTANLQNISQPAG